MATVAGPGIANGVHMRFWMVVGLGVLVGACGGGKLSSEETDTDAGIWLMSDDGGPAIDGGGLPRADGGNPEPEPEPVPTACASAEEAEVIRLANAVRTSMGLGMLTCHDAIAVTARKHSQDMCRQDYFSHTGLDGSSPFDRMRREGVSYRTAGENIAWGQSTAAAVHEAWMNSRGHRANILNGAFGRIGVGYERCGGRPYWTQVFAD